MTKKSVAVIGSGPSGLTAAIYTSRASLATTVFTGMQPGGQLTTTTEIENFPGAWSEKTKHGEMGPDLMARIQSQAEHFGAEVRFAEEITRIVVNNPSTESQSTKPTFTLINSYGDEQEFDAVIIATGATARYLGIEGEQEWVGKGYHTCATCDGYFYKQKVVAVVGGGDSAFEEAQYLTNHAEKVYIIHRREDFRASKIMVDRAKQNSNIEFLCNYTVDSFIIDENRFHGVNLKHTKGGEDLKLALDGLFVAIGHVPNTRFVSPILTVDQAGYLLTRNALYPAKLAQGEAVDKGYVQFGNMSEIEGIFIAGDVEDTVYRQAITAAGDGCKAAMDCERWLES